MKPRLTPLEINLKELPPEGRDFHYTRETGEMSSALEDLIGDNPFEVRLHITPAGNSFDLRGEIRTSMNLQCSLCAIDFKHPVSLNVHELLLVQEPMGKNDHLTKTNHAHEWESGGPDYMMLESAVFSAADYVHEMVALAEPIRPLGKPDCDLTCENISEPQRKYLAESRENGVNSSPFRVLEKFKLKS